MLQIGNIPGESVYFLRCDQASLASRVYFLLISLIWASPLNIEARTVRIRGIVLTVPLLSFLLALSGCGLMPVSGPATMDILAGQRDQTSLPYAIVKVTPKVIDVLAKNAPRLIAFNDRRRPRDIVFGIGDIVSVTVFEAASGGLFIPAEGGVRPGNFITIPNQPVDVHGNISIPYAGSIRALGRTQVQVQDSIVSALKNRAIEPQAVV